MLLHSPLNLFIFLLTYHLMNYNSFELIYKSFTGLCLCDSSTKKKKYCIPCSCLRGSWITTLSSAGFCPELLIIPYPFFAADVTQNFPDILQHTLSICLMLIQLKFGFSLSGYKAPVNQLDSEIFTLHAVIEVTVHSSTLVHCSTENGLIIAVVR